MSNKQLHIAIPTTTIIAAHKDNPYLVAVFTSTGKHGSKLVIPGGKVKVGKENWLQTGITEVGEELKIKNFSDVKFFCLASDPNRDIRPTTLEKLLDGRDDGPEELPGIDIVGHYTFDVVLTATTDDDLVPDPSEAKDARYIDVREVQAEDFALDHGKMIVAYREYLETGKLPALDRF